MQSSKPQLPELINYINGGTSTPTVDRRNSLCNANTAEPIQAQLSCDADQVEEALQAAHSAYEKGEWDHTAAAERADILDKIADELAKPEQADVISHADAITTGAIIRTTRKMASIVPM